MSAPFSRTAADHWDHLGALTFEARSILTYLLTCRHRTPLQVFRVPAAYICADTAAGAAVVEAALAELEAADRIVREGDLVLLLDGHRHDPPANTNQCIHRLTLVHEGRMPAASPEFRARALVSLADALDRALAGMRQTAKAEELGAREAVRASVEEMRREAALLDPSLTVPEGSPNGSETVPESRARGRAGAGAGAGAGVGVGGEDAREARPGRRVLNPRDCSDIELIGPTERQRVLLEDRARAAGTTVQAAAASLGIPIAAVNMTTILRHLEGMAARRASPSRYPDLADALDDVGAGVQRHD